MSGKVRGLSWADLIAYDPIGGSLVWTVRRGFTKPGHVAGATVNGYFYVTLDGKRYPGAAIAWELMTGRKPRHRIHFANGDRSDLRWANICARKGGQLADVDIGLTTTPHGTLVQWVEDGKPVSSLTVKDPLKLVEILSQWVATNVQHRRHTTQRPGAGSEELRG
jgi:hypothetical protein